MLSEMPWDGEYAVLRIFIYVVLLILAPASKTISTAAIAEVFANAAEEKPPFAFLCAILGVLCV